jgi:hypothetical protein
VLDDESEVIERNGIMASPSVEDHGFGTAQSQRRTSAS